MPPPILEARRLVKKFPGVVALNEVSFQLHPGEIHALCGENGAGKSTLIKLLSGLHPWGSFEGELLLSDTPARFHSRADAADNGIAVIYQELALVEEMTVAENIFLGNEPRTHLGLIDWNQIRSDSIRLLERFNVSLDPDAPVGSLGVGQKQLVEILKALSKQSRILILDEPTAALAEHEVAILLDILRELRRSGVSCIYISHKLDEVFAISDRITVLRDGRSVASLQTKATQPQEVIKHMVGREISDLFPRRSSTPGKMLLQVEGLFVRDPRAGVEFLRDIHLSLRAGEVLGIGGLMGAGRTELLMHLFGMWGNRTRGNVHLDGLPLTNEGPDTIIQRGMVLVSEDRRRYGLFLEKSVSFNLSLSALRALSHAGTIDAGKEREVNAHLFHNLQIKASSMDSPVGKLSGGNQQKVVLGRALLTQPKVILLDEPTRGIDVGAKLEIYALINQLTASGKAVVLVSSELPELMGMSDRILMLHQGSVGGVFDRSEATQEQLLTAALGRSQVRA